MHANPMEKITHPLEEENSSKKQAFQLQQSLKQRLLQNQKAKMRAHE
jgi:protease II